MKTALLSLAVAGVGMGAPPGAAAAARPIVANYTCDRELSLKVVFSGSNAAVTLNGGRTVLLRQGLTADGFLYSSRKYSLRGRGNDAVWTAGAEPVNCKAKSETAPGEAQ
ncbi:MAG: MliC family protein [Bacillota bacterium]